MIDIPTIRDKPLPWRLAVRAFAFLFGGVRRAETTREAELRLAVTSRDAEIDGLKLDKAMLESELHLRKQEIRLMADMIECERTMIARLTATAAMYTAWAEQPRGTTR